MKKTEEGGDAMVCWAQWGGHEDGVWRPVLRVCSAWCSQACSFSFTYRADS